MITQHTVSIRDGRVRLLLATESGADEELVLTPAEAADLAWEMSALARPLDTRVSKATGREAESQFVKAEVVEDARGRVRLVTTRRVVTTAEVEVVEEMSPHSVYLATQGSATFPYFLARVGDRELKWFPIGPASGQSRFFGKSHDSVRAAVEHVLGEGFEVRVCDSDFAETSGLWDKALTPHLYP